MKCFLIALLSCMLTDAYAQRFATGILSGTGFTDYHGHSSTGKWQAETGPVSGAFFRYDFTPIFSVSTEMNFTSQEYYYKPYKTTGDYYHYYPLDFDPVYGLYPVYYPPSNQRWEYSFLRFPLYLTLSTPTRLQFSLSAGVYLSFTLDDDYSGQTYYGYPSYRNMVYYDPAESETPKHDNGFMYAASLSYPISDAFRMYLHGRYFIGHRPFIGSSGGRTGVSELTLGIAYSGLFRSKETARGHKSGSDTVFCRFLVSPRIGPSISWFRDPGRPDTYSAKAGMFAAVWTEFRFDKTFSFLSGVGFERKGYELNDSSVYFYKHATAAWSMYQVDTRVDIDYAVLPFMLKVRMGSGFKAYITGGGYLGIKLNSRVTGEAVYSTTSEYGYTLTEITVYDDIEGNISNIDAGWMCGAGIEFPLARRSMLEIGVLYEAGKVNILNNDDPNAEYLLESDNMIRNSSVALQIGLVFPIQGTR